MGSNMHYEWDNRPERTWEEVVAEYNRRNPEDQVTRDHAIGAVQRGIKKLKGALLERDLGIFERRLDW